jgi:ABC-type branched-subunit amino acid transport system ATPase component
MTPRLQLEAVSFSYGHVQVLFDVSLHVEPGEVVALLGTNGAGKSTLLRVASGLSRASAGSIRLDGASIERDSPEERFKRGIVLMPGGRAVFPGLTVVDNLRAGAFTLRHDKRALRERIDATLLEFPALGASRDRPARTLSGGQQQMLGLAKSLLCEPAVLMIDELSLGLAPAAVGELLRRVRNLSERGVSILLVEQSVNIAMSVAERAIFLERGQVRFEGATEDLEARDDLVRSIFFATPGAAT